MENGEGKVKADNDRCYRELSVAVAPELHVGNPDYFSRLEPRIGRLSQLSDDATIQCQIDALGEADVGEVMGGLNMHCGGWTMLAFPYCLPDRVAMVSYGIEAAFIQDDKDFTEPADEEARQVQRRREGRMKQVLSKLVANLVQTDAELGREIVRQWEAWEVGVDRIKRKVDSYENLDEYLTGRVEDIACGYVWSLCRFAAALSLSTEEEAMIGPVLKPLIDTIILHNDYFSWERERAQHEAGGGSVPLVNAVAFHMRWHRHSAAEAKAAVRARAVQVEDEYLARKRDFLARERPSPALLKWLDCWERIVAGNLLWSIYSPRYRPATARNPYKDYMERRRRDGHLFLSDPALSPDILDEAGAEVSTAEPGC